MDHYTNDLKRYPLITREEEILLYRQMKFMCFSPEIRDKARSKMITSNLRLVVKIAHDFREMAKIPDLVSVGNSGLINAVDKFNPNKGAKFSSYAAWWIKQSMRREAYERSKVIRVPIAANHKMRKLRAIKAKHYQEHGRPADIQYLSEQMELRPRSVFRLILCDPDIVSIQDQQFDNKTYEASVGHEDHPALSNNPVQRIKGLFESSNLTDREKRILTFRFGLDGGRPKTLEEVARLEKRTRERVRQIQKVALKKIRQNANLSKWY